MLGDISFLKFVAANQGFPGKAQGRAGCWRVSPIPGCPTSDDSPGPKTKQLQVFPSKAREGITGRLKQQVCFCPRMRQTTVRRQGELKINLQGDRLYQFKSHMLLESNMPFPSV